MGYSSRTAPESVQTQPYRLEEDFGNIPATDSQNLPLTSEGSAADLAQIGMMDAFAPAASHISNLHPHPSQGQDLNLLKDQQAKPAPQLSTEEVVTFLKNYTSNVSNNRVMSAIETTVLSLQSASSSGEANKPLTPAPAPALDRVNFQQVTREKQAVYVCSWEGCNKSMKRQCDLRKHYARHTLPWACTFDGCLSSRRRFGSKNDWKRHESKQHEQQEKWRCGELDSNISGESVPATGREACMRLLCTKELYLQHLQDSHHITDSNVTNKLCESQKIGAKCQGQYWCGFCNEIITMEAKGLEGDAERFNHIDYHFIKDHRLIEDWTPLNGRPSPGESTPSAELSSPGQSSEAESEEGETDEADAGEAQAAQATPSPQGTGKRPASMIAGGDPGPPSKAARSATHFIYCCACGNNFESWQGVCTNCHHHPCRSCVNEVVRVREQD